MSRFLLFGSRLFWPEKVFDFFPSNFCSTHAGNHARSTRSGWWIYVWIGGFKRVAGRGPQYFTYDKSRASTLQSCAQSRSPVCNSGVAATTMNELKFYLVSPFCSHKLHIVSLLLLFLTACIIFSCTFGKYPSSYYALSIDLISNYGVQ